MLFVGCLLFSNLLFMPAASAGTVVTAAMVQAEATAKINAAVADLHDPRPKEIVFDKCIFRDSEPYEGNISYDVSIPGGIRYGAVVPVHVKVVVNGRVKRNAICYFKIHVYQKVVVAAHDLLPEKELTEGDIYLEDREVNSTSARYLTDKSKVLGQVLNRSVKQGKMLTENMLQQPVVITARTPVDIVATVNNVQVKIQGEAVESGRVDEIIRVRNLRSGKVLKGRVIDAQTVEIV